MPTVRRASAPCNPSPALCPDDRLDEPSLRELARDALILAGLLPFRDFRTEAAAEAVRITLTAPALLDAALDALAGFDRYADGATALRVAFAGDMVRDAREAA